MNIRQLNNDSTLLEALKLSCLCFNYPFDTKGKSEAEYVEFLRTSTEDKALNECSTVLGAFTDTDELMSFLCYIPYEFYFDGTIVDAVGIGNVCTYPQHRRKGAIRGLFIESLKKMYNEGCAFSYLYPFSESFYNRFGYMRLSNSIQRNYSLISLPEEKPKGSFHLYGLDATEQEFEQVYTSFASKLNLMVKRDEMDWKNLRDAKGGYNNNYAYLYKNSDNIPCGYLILKGIKVDGTPILACREMVFDNYETLKALLSFARTYAQDYRSIRFYTPAYYNLDILCKDYTAGISTVSSAQNGMVRVVNVEKVLYSATYQGSGSFNIKIDDNYIKENTQTYKIEYKDGKAINITSSNSEEQIDAFMPIDIFSAAIVGNYESRDFEWIEKCKINCSIEKLGEIFYKKPCFINNYF